MFPLTWTGVSSEDLQKDAPVFKKLEPIKTIACAGKTAAVLAVTAALAGCAAGPDFHVPVTPAPEAYTAAPLPTGTAEAPVPGGASQKFVPGRDIPPLWWELFHSKELDRLIRQAIADSPTYAAAQAALREARENRRAQMGTLFPSVDAQLTGTRQKFTGASFGQPEASGSTFTLVNASLNLSYTLDLSGATRRGLEALQAQVDYQRFLVHGTYLTLTSNIVTTAVKEASIRATISSTEEIIKLLEEQLRLIQRQFELGGGSRSDVLAQQAQLAQTRATLPPLEKDLTQTRHQMAILTGVFPGQAARLPVFTLDGLQLPVELPVSLPSSLVRQRPDIRASEELLHQASAEIGVATANMLPRVTITAGLGSEATVIENLFAGGTSIWNLGAGLLQPVFHGGELAAKRRAAIAAYDQALAQYKDTVLKGFKEVADVLAALDLDARTLKAQAEAEVAARDSLDVARKQFQAGAVNYLTLLNAERQFEQARINMAQARAARIADTAALFQALGGGWWNEAGTTRD